MALRGSDCSKGGLLADLRPQNEVLDCIIIPQLWTRTEVGQALTLAHKIRSSCQTNENQELEETYEIFSSKEQGRGQAEVQGVYELQSDRKIKEK